MGVLEQLLALMRWKRMILVNTAIVAAASVVVALLLPQWYRSTASIFPPEEEDSWTMGSMSSLVTVATLGMTKRTLPIWGSPSDVYAAVLKSRTVQEEIIRRFDLMKELKATDMDRALQRFKRRVRIKVSGEGVVSVQVQDRSPQRAADMANAMIDLLDQINRERRNVSGRQARIFVEARLAQNRQDLAAAEESLRAIQERTGVLVPDEQARIAIAAATDLNKQLLLEEIDLAAMKGTVGPEHPDRQQLEREVASLRAKVLELERGPVGTQSPPRSPLPARAREAGAFKADSGQDPRATGSAGEPPEIDNVRIPLDQYPLRSMEALRALREVKVQEAIYEYLNQQYETYRIQEKRDTPMVQVLDRARPATRRTLPIRWLICTCATLSAFVLSVLLAVELEALSRLKRNSPERFQRLRDLARELKLAAVVDRL